MRHLQELYEKYKDQGLVVLGIDPADDKKIALNLLAENGVTFPNIIDPSDAARRASDRDYPMAAWPTSYIIDRNGLVVDAWPGYDEGELRALAALQKTGGKLAEAIRRDMDEKVMKSAPEVAAAAEQLFQAIRAADYDRDWMANDDWKRFPSKDVDYFVDHDAPGWTNWVCKKFKANPITDVKLGKVFANPQGSPSVYFELRLKDGEILQGDLSFRWNSERKQWFGWKGLDWHLKK
jgi:peroxiredoxin